MNESAKDVTIVGGGFAGLAAALRLLRAGLKLRIVEKRAFFGGRAYSFKDTKTGETVDNGQHLLMGCYHETLEFLRELGTLDRLEIEDRLAVSFAEGPRGRFDLRCPRLPAPFHLAWGLLKYRGLGWRDKKGMAALMRFSKRAAGNGKDLDEISVSELFRRTGQSEAAIRKFWEPFGLATLNESLDLASADLFVEVLRRALLSKKSDSDIALAKVGLSELYATPAQNLFQEKGVVIDFNTQIESIAREAAGFRLATNTGKSWHSDRVILAVPPNALGKILEASGGEFAGLVPGLERFASAPIVSINLWFENFRPPRRMTGLVDSPVHWLFDKSRIHRGESSKHLTLVVSAAHALAMESKENLIGLAVAELGRFFPELEGQRPIHSQIVKEQQATFSARRGLARFRPDERTRIPGLYLAGDWTNTRLPATIESAVLSGHKAAGAILKPAP